MSVSAESSAVGGADPADAGTAFKLLLSCPPGLPASRVSVKFDSAYDRIRHPDANLEESINEIWSQRVQKSPSLYNGLKFRYGGHTTQYEDGLNQISSICLHLGLTDYRTFVGTNLNPLWERFLVPSADDSLRCQHTSSPLGNGAIVETSDGKILVLQRSQNVGEFPGYFVFPGGHSEAPYLPCFYLLPRMKSQLWQTLVGGTCHSTVHYIYSLCVKALLPAWYGVMNEKTTLPQEIGVSTHCDRGAVESAVINQKVSMEMFDGIIREVFEEIGVPAESLTNPLFIGISRRVMNVRPTAFFFLKCSLEANEVRELYSRAQDGYESSQICTVSRDDLKKIAVKMPGCHHGGHALYELMMEALKDN